MIQNPNEQPIAVTWTPYGELIPWEASYLDENNGMWPHHAETIIRVAVTGVADVTEDRVIFPVVDCPEATQ